MNGLGRKNKNNTKSNEIFSIETLGMALLLFSFLCFTILITRDLLFGDIGEQIAFFLLGAAGYASYAICLCMFYIGIVLVTGKKITASPKAVAVTLLTIFLLTTLIHTITSHNFSYESMKVYIKQCYDAGFGEPLSATGGGVLFAIIMYPVIKLLTVTGVYILTAFIFIVILYSLTKNSASGAVRERKGSYHNKKISGFKRYPDVDFDFSADNDENIKQSKRLHSIDDEFALKTKKEMRTNDKKRSESVKILYPSGKSNFDAEQYFKSKNKEQPSSKDYSKAFSESIDSGSDYKPKPLKIFNDNTKISNEPTTNFINKDIGNVPPLKEDFIGFDFLQGGFSSKPQADDDSFEQLNSSDYDGETLKQSNIPNALSGGLSEHLQTEFDDDIGGSLSDDFIEQVSKPNEVTPVQSKKTKIIKKPLLTRYNSPPNELFNEISLKMDTSKENFEENIKIIEETLNNFEIPAKVVNTIHGPTVTRYDIDIPPNIQSKRVLQYADDIAMRLRSKFGVRIEQNPGEGVLAIEVPNIEMSVVGLKTVLADKKFREVNGKSLSFGIGMDVTGSVIIGDIVKMTHLLVAGSTGSGKSVCLNTLIISLITKYSPDDLRLILIDPKRVEFTIYNNLPHLVINEIINDSTKTISSLNWAISEMERRYVLFNDATVRDIDEYNESIDKSVERKLPKIVIIVDELADLMTSNKKEIEDRIMKLTQKSRAAGIHLVLATQRPSVDIITGVIKTNLPSRIAFMVSSAIDSRTILDESGAEKLLGNGDMLYKMGNMKMPMRVQGAYISMKEVKAIVTYIKENNESYFDEEVSNYINAVKDEENSFADTDADGKVEDVYIEALKTVIQAGQASISMIQRRYSVGYNKAGKIIDWMENMGYITPFEGSKSRQVLISMESFEEKYGDI